MVEQQKRVLGHLPSNGGHTEGAGGNCNEKDSGP